LHLLPPNPQSPKSIIAASFSPAVTPSEASSPRNEPGPPGRQTLANRVFLLGAPRALHQQNPIADVELVTLPPGISPPHPLAFSSV
jgi:hypothetical protein